MRLEQKHKAILRYGIKKESRHYAIPLRLRSNGGSGLGLSIVSQIIEQHQGKLKIESRLNQGTIVHIYIPIWEEDV